jgi:predicted neutral ceramidase superfamily lipid hydrolase
MHATHENYELLLFLEGVLIGLYGNWLISYIDKIELSNVLYTAMLQFVLIVISVFTFVGFCMFSIMQPHRIFAAKVTGSIHLLFIYSAYAINMQFSFLMWWNFVLGVGIFAFIYMIDIRRNLMRSFLKHES